MRERAGLRTLVEWARTYPASTRYIAFCVTATLLLQIADTVKG